MKPWNGWTERGEVVLLADTWRGTVLTPALATKLSAQKIAVFL